MGQKSKYERAPIHPSFIVIIHSFINANASGDDTRRHATPRAFAMECVRARSPSFASIARDRSEKVDVHATTTLELGASTPCARARSDAHTRDAREVKLVVDRDFALYLGGSTWALDWRSTSHGVNVLACDARASGHHEHARASAGTCAGRGVIFVVSVSEDGVVISSAHEHGAGCCVDVKWDARGDAFATSEGEGALGVALGNGKVEVWIVRLANQGRGNGENERRTVFRGAAPRAYGGVTCLDWNRVVPGRLAAGYSSGNVVVWDIVSDSRGEGDAVKAPTFVIAAAAHAGPCRCVAWAPEDYSSDASASANVFACASDYTTKPHLFDLRSPFAPIGDVFERGQGWMTSLTWLPRGSLVAGFDGGDRSSAKDVKGGKRQKLAMSAKASVHQFDFTTSESSLQTTYVGVPGRGTAWCVDARPSPRPESASAMVACATSNGVVCVKPMRYVSKRLRAASANVFETCGGLAAYDAEAGRRLATNPVDAPTCFDFITSDDGVSWEDELYPPLAVARPGTRDAPTTAQHRARWSRGGDEWWLASAGEAGFLRLQRFDAKSIVDALDALDAANA